MLIKNQTTDQSFFDIVSKSPDELKDVRAKRSPKDIIGYDLVFADWSARHKRELDSGRLVDVKSEISINKQSIQSVENSIYDKELGELPDSDKDVREFSCDCGATYGRFFEGNICPVCGTPVRCQYNQDIKRVGWIDISPFVIINPNAYDMLCKVIGTKNLPKILQYDIVIDLDGNLKPASTQTVSRTGVVKQNVPFANIGMMEFRNNFETILSTYASMRGEEEMAKFLIENKDVIFSSYIPVSSTYLRPTFTSSKKRSVSFDKSNAVYVKIITNASLLRRVMKKDVEFKRSLNVVFDIQKSLQELYVLTIKSKLSGKNKMIRGSILGNRMNFSSRMVIRSYTGVKCGIDKVEMSYKAFLEINLLEIINALMRGYADPMFTTMTVYEVIEYVTKCQYSEKIDDNIWKVIQTMLKKRPHNPVLVNRPPTLALGSMQYFEVNSIAPNAKDKTLALPLSSLSALNADFDGDTLSVYGLKERCIVSAFMEGLSPKRLIIDRTGDSYFNNDFGLIKDEYTSLISFLS